METHKLIILCTTLIVLCGMFLGLFERLHLRTRPKKWWEFLFVLLVKSVVNPLKIELRDALKGIDSVHRIMVISNLAACVITFLSFFVFALFTLISKPFGGGLFLFVSFLSVLLAPVFTVIVLLISKKHVF